MKKISKLMAVVVVLTGVFYIGVVGLAQTSSASFTIQPAWVAVGFSFYEASTQKDIAQVYAWLPGTPPYSLKNLFDQWKVGVITRQKVRPALLAYAKATGGYNAIENFRLGEWGSHLLVTEKWFQNAIKNKDSQKAMFYMIDIEFLARQVQEFIDILPANAPKDVIDGLNKIALASAKIDVAKIMNGTASDDEKHEFSAALLSLPKYVQQIILAIIQ